MVYKIPSPWWELTGMWGRFGVQARTPQLLQLGGCCCAHLQLNNHVQIMESQNVLG